MGDPRAGGRPGLTVAEVAGLDRRSTPAAGVVDAAVVDDLPARARQAADAAGV